MDDETVAPAGKNGNVHGVVSLRDDFEGVKLGSGRSGGMDELGSRLPVRLREAAKNATSRLEAELRRCGRGAAPCQIVDTPSE